MDERTVQEVATLSEGEIGDLHVGLKGTTNASFVKALAHKTWRVGKVEFGKGSPEAD